MLATPVLVEPAANLGSKPLGAVFISHAAPADNEITRWLALRLMREGYTVWCDIERLRVGDDFWREIEDEIRNNTAKFILVITQTSVTRTGVLNELGVAAKVAKHRPKRFILPIRADNISYDDFPIEANRLDAADFSKNWSVGLARLLQILEEDGVPKKSDDAAAVGAWWRSRHSATEGVKEEMEEYFSNRFRISSSPKFLHLHTLNDLKPFDGKKFQPLFPVHQFAGLFASFATAADLRPAFVAAEADVGGTFSVRLDSFLTDGFAKPKIEARDARNIVVRLMRLAFESKLRAVGLRPYELANKANYFWFPSTVIAPRKQVAFIRPNQTKGSRALLGTKSLKDKTGAIVGAQGWHFGLEVIPTTWPAYGFQLRSHVAFTRDGEPYADSAKQHRLRRRECKSWFNDKWGDMLLAAMAHLAGGETVVHVPVGTGAEFAVTAWPDRFVSPVKFTWEKDKEMPAYEPESEEDIVPVEDVEAGEEDEEEDVDE